MFRFEANLKKKKTLKLQVFFENNSLGKQNRETMKKSKNEEVANQKKEHQKKMASYKTPIA